MGISRDFAYCEEYYGWVKKENIDAPCDYFPTPVHIRENGYIYSEPNMDEIYRIGYAEHNDDHVTTLSKISKTIIDDEWINIQFPEWLLLKNKDLKQRMIIGDKKFIVQEIGVIVGAVIGRSMMIGYYSSVNSNIFIGLLYLIGGAALGGVIGSVLPEIYNQKIIGDYKKNEKR